MTTITLMDATEARDVVRRINEHLGNLRALLLDLHNRKGWQALGYTSWRECVNAEFAYEESYLYRLLSAARVEGNLDLPMGEIPERQLRELAQVEPEQQKIVWDVINLTAKEFSVPVTTSLIKSAVNVITTGILTKSVGGEVALTAAAKMTLSDEMSERLKRQNQYIHDAVTNTTTKPLINDVMTVNEAIVLLAYYDSTRKVKVVVKDVL